MRFALVGHGGSSNRGCEAIVRSTVALLSEAFPGAEFDLLSSRPKTDLTITQDFPNVTLHAARLPPNSRDVLDRFLKRCWQTSQLQVFNDWRILRQNLYSIRRVSSRCDAFLFIGGDNFTSDYGYPRYEIQTLRYAIERRKPTCLWAASVGPFHDPVLLKEMQALLREVTLITARENLTVDYLASIGVSDNVRRVADPAFLLPPGPVKDLRARLMEKSKMVIGLNASGLLARYTAEGGAGLVATLSEFVYEVRRRYQAVFVLVPHVLHPVEDTEPFSCNRDLNLLQHLSENLGRPDWVVLPEESLGAQETKALIGQCDIFIGARTHSLIAALSMGVPSLGIAYSNKTPGIFLDVLGDAQFVIHASELSLNTLLDTFSQLVSKSESVRNQLQARIPAVQRLAWEGARFLREVLDEKTRA